MNKSFLCIQLQVMSPSAATKSDIITDENNYLWEFTARMTLAGKEILDHVAMKPEGVMEQATAEWKTADLKALSIITRMLIPVLQSMIRNATSAAHAWSILREFHAKRSLHNRVQLRKQLHESVMNPGDNIMDHFIKFNDLCTRLDSVGDDIMEDEKLVILLGSLSPEYDTIVRIIEARGHMDPYEAKEMLRRNCDITIKLKKQETAFKAVTSRGQPRGRRDVMRGCRNNCDNQEKRRQRRQEKQGNRPSRGL